VVVKSTTGTPRPPLAATPLEKRGMGKEKISLLKKIVSEGNGVLNSPLSKRGDPDKIWKILSGSGC
jgi:hypothetical protein